jgi:hypothetical protein
LIKPRILVEPPVNAQVDTAIMILHFGFGEVGVLARTTRADGACLVAGHAIEFVGLETEAKVIRAVEPSEDLE